MKKKSYFSILLFVIIALVPIAGAQQPSKVFRLGYLSIRPGLEPRDAVFRQRLRELGYIEGTNIAIEFGAAPARQTRPLPAERTAG